MKKIWIRLTAALMLLCVSCAFAADRVELESTQNFLKTLYNKGFLCTDNPANEDGIEEVAVPYSSKLGDITFHVFFTPGNVMMIRVWNLVKAECTPEEAYCVCNELNGTYMYAKFFVDTSDNSVSIASDMTVPTGTDCGEACFDHLKNMVRVVEDASDKLAALCPEAMEAGK